MSSTGGPKQFAIFITQGVAHGAGRGGVAAAFPGALLGDLRHGDLSFAHRQWPGSAPGASLSLPVPSLQTGLPLDMAWIVLW